MLNLGEFDFSGIEIVVGAFFGEKLVLSSSFNDLSLVENHDFIRVSDGGKTVGDDHDSSILLEGIQALLNEHFASGIDVACCFVENHDRRPIETGPR